LTDAPDATPDGAATPTGVVTSAAAPDRPRPRRIVVVLTAFLTLVGLGVFVAPFAFPIHPPVVQGIRSTVAFSPDGAAGGRDIARISLRMNEPGSLTVSVVDPSDRGGAVRKVVSDGHAGTGKRAIQWDGTDTNGKFVGDGRYIVNIKARADKKSWSGNQRSWNSNRSIIVDTAPPKVARVAVQSSIALGGKGACQVQATTAEAGTLTIDAIAAPGTGTPVATRSPAPAGKNATVKWSWDGTAKGTPVPAGLYVIHASLADRLGNATQTTSTCWVAHGGGAVVPSAPKRGETVRVRLTGTDGKPLPATTPVTLSLAERNGALGGSTLDVVGESIGGVARGPLGQVKLVMPRKRGLDGLWLVATTSTQRVIIPLRP
jgi:flagellar hook assembly protein FlgD